VIALNKKGYTSSELTYWAGVVIVLVGVSLTIFSILTKSVADNDLDISETRHFALKQAIIDSCFKKINFDIARITDKSITDCVNIDASVGINIELMDLEGKLINKVSINENLIDAKGLCGLSQNLVCSNFKNLINIGDKLRILKIEVVSQK